MTSTLRWLAVACTAIALTACGDSTPSGGTPPTDTGPTDTPSADVSADVKPGDVPETDTPPADVPPADVTPTDVPETDTPPADAPPTDTPPADGGCPGSQEMCGSTCVDTSTDPMNCGVCGNACPSGQSCTSGTCACASGQVLCSGMCVDTQTSATNCGACGTACPTGQSCAAGRCAVPCAAPRSVCGAGASMACVDTQSDSMNCGSCGTACAAGQSCVAGACTCPMGENACSGMCVNTQTDAANCGGCGMACATGQRCEMGRCACPSGQTPCGGRCVDVSSDSANCGLCGNACPSGQLCSSGTCAVTCASPSRICTTGGRMVCVNVQTDIANCGACGTACATGQTCAMGACACPGAQSVCGGRCVDTRSDNDNCGACGTACAGGQSCVAGSCACPSGQVFCGGRCVDPLTDNNNCGRCSNACSGGQSCTGGVCSCPGGGTSCGGRCTDTNSDLSNCGRCSNACAAPTNARAVCATGACSFACNTGFGDCDRVASNGCEVNTTNNTLNCGACGTACRPPANAAATCTAGACGFTCLAGFADCDGSAANGCEVNLQTNTTNCGRCGTACGIGQLCSAGACMLACMSGTTLCSGTCVSTATDPRNCGACGTVCASGANSAPTCAASACGLSCTPGFGNCDGVVTNGCEVNVQSTVANCGRCGNACPSGANSTALCSAGTCGLSCTAGFGNCDGVATNGCEVNTQTAVANCGACGRVCPAGTNATATCAAGSCGTTCNTGFGDCNGSTADGCETNVTNNVGNCGRCGNACVVPTGGSVACTSSACVQSCPTGQTACSNACVNLQLDRANCGSCGRACATGQVCAAGACVTISGPSFQIGSLTTASCQVVDHEAITGDDRGGIAVSPQRMFYSGDTSTARFDLANLGTVTALGRVVDGFVTNLRDGTVYTLANDTTPITNSTTTVNGLMVLDGSTGAVTATRVAFSTPITGLPTGYYSNGGVFSGYDRILLYTGSRIYHIDLRTASTGTVAVADLGPFTLPTHNHCENWAIWGTTEFYGGNLYVDYVQSSTAIARTRVPDGATTIINTFTNLSDMCSFTVSTANNRWYFHHEYSGQFGGTAETAGYCNASWTTDTPTVSIVTFPSTSSSLGGPAGTVPLGTTGARFRTGDYVQEAFTRTTATSRLDLNFQMADLTSGCAVGQSLTWNVLVNGIVVGTYGFAGGSGVNPRTITGTYTFASQAAGSTTIRLEATSTVCSGGSSWNWIAGGTATLR